MPNDIEQLSARQLVEMFRFLETIPLDRGAEKQKLSNPEEKSGDFDGFWRDGVKGNESIIESYVTLREMVANSPNKGMADYNDTQREAFLGLANHVDSYFHGPGLDPGSYDKEKIKPGKYEKFEEKYSAQYGRWRELLKLGDVRASVALENSDDLARDRDRPVLKTRPQANHRITNPVEEVMAQVPEKQPDRVSEIKGVEGQNHDWSDRVGQIPLSSFSRLRPEFMSHMVPTKYTPPSPVIEPEPEVEPVQSLEVSFEASDITACAHEVKGMDSLGKTMDSDKVSLTQCINWFVQTRGEKFELGNEEELLDAVKKIDDKIFDVNNRQDMTELTELVAAFASGKSVEDVKASTFGEEITAQMESILPEEPGTGENLVQGGARPAALNT